MSNLGGRRDPIYLQIAASLRQDIFDGVYPAGTQLPTGDMLCVRFGVSRNTVREATRLLRDEGLVASRKRGGFVVTTPAPIDVNFARAATIDDVVDFSKHQRFKMESIGMEHQDPTLATWSKMPADDLWLVFSGGAYRDRSGPPECWATYYVAKDYAVAAKLAKEYTGGLLVLIEAMFGIAIDALYQEITASLISEEIAERLEVGADSPAITVRRMCKTADGTLVFMTSSVYPAGRFRYATVLHRAGRR